MKKSPSSDSSNGPDMNCCPPQPENPGLKSRLGLLFRIALSLGILGILAVSLDLREVGGLFVGLRWEFFVLVLVLIVFERILNAWKWGILLRANGSEIGLWVLIRIQLTSGCVGILVPSALGMDVLRMVAISRCTTKPVQAIVASAVDRGVSVFLTLFFAAIASVIAGGVYIPWSLAMFFPLIFLAVIIAGAAMMIPGLNNWVYPFLIRVIGVSMASKIQTIFASFKEFRGYKGALLLNVLIFCLIAVLRVAIVYFEAMALNIQAGFFLLLLVLPFTWVALMLPVSIGGIGLQEGAYFAFFRGIGIGGAAAVSISILEHLLVRIVTLPGLFFYLRGGLVGGKFEESVDQRSDADTDEQACNRDGGDVDAGIGGKTLPVSDTSNN